MRSGRLHPSFRLQQLRADPPQVPQTTPLSGRRAAEAIRAPLKAWQAMTCTISTTRLIEQHRHEVGEAETIQERVREGRNKRLTCGAAALHDHGVRRPMDGISPTMELRAVSSRQLSHAASPAALQSTSSWSGRASLPPPAKCFPFKAKNHLFSLQVILCFFCRFCAAWRISYLIRTP